jgi:hypothetical protein
LPEQARQASLVVVGKEKGQPVPVDAPHDRFDIERRSVGRVEVQLSDATLIEALRRPHLGAPATHIDRSEQKETLSGFHDHGPRHGESRVSPWTSLGPRIHSTSKKRAGVDRARSGRTSCSRSGPCTHGDLLRNAMGCVANPLHPSYDANSPVRMPDIGLWSTPHPRQSRRVNGGFGLARGVEG